MDVTRRPPTRVPQPVAVAGQPTLWNWNCPANENREEAERPGSTGSLGGWGTHSMDAVCFALN